MPYSRTVNHKIDQHFLMHAGWLSLGAIKQAYNLVGCHEPCRSSRVEFKVANVSGRQVCDAIRLFVHICLEAVECGLTELLYLLRLIESNRHVQQTLQLASPTIPLPNRVKVNDCNNPTFGMLHTFLFVLSPHIPLI